MVFSRFRAGIVVRIALLLLTLTLVAWVAANRPWYVMCGILLAAVAAQASNLVKFVEKSHREVAAMLDAIAADDASMRPLASFGDEGLADAIGRVLIRLRATRSEREEQDHYFQTLIGHVPVALISLDDSGTLQLLNKAARRLFETTVTNAAQFSRYGAAFSVALQALQPGTATIVRMERTSSSLQLKAAATGLTLGGLYRRLISLQNIENEMSAHEMAAWQTVMRAMAHEVMNSLTPVTSLAATTRELLIDVINRMPVDDPQCATLSEAREALDTVCQRSEGLLRFVQGHRRLTKQMVTQVEITPLRRVFARLQRLFATDPGGRALELQTSVEPETLEVSVDVGLLDQALINLVRNAIDALRDAPAGRIVLFARRDSDGRVAVAVADNGPGVSAEQREKIFVPFFTTKRQGSGLGLSIVRQIATAHGAVIDVSQTPGGGATFSLRF